MKMIFAGLGLALSVALAVPAAAQGLGSVTTEPAATLLLPYFEVNLSQPNKSNTFVSVNNASATAILVHATVWSDAAIPVLAFNFYLTGYDVQTINMADVLDGTLPRTASAGQDPTDTISPKGQFSQDINFASCTGQFPIPQLPAVFVDHLHNSLTGHPTSIYSGLCAAINHGDNVARGYMTFDTVNNCTLRFPGEPGYFSPGGTGDATNQNVLWGDYSLVNTTAGKAWGESLVHIRASGTDPETSVAGQYTFYGRLDSFTAADNRQPLATDFAARYRSDSKTKTNFVAWRDPKVALGAAPNYGSFNCAIGHPVWYPLGQEGVVVFDEQEHPFVPPTFPVAPQPPQATYIPFPGATQRVLPGSAVFEVPFTAGWIYFNLNTTVAAAGSNPPEDPAAAQAWLSTAFETKKYSTGADVTRLDNAQAASHFTP